MYQRLGLWLVILGLWIWLQLYVALLLAFSVKIREVHTAFCCGISYSQASPKKY